MKTTAISRRAYQKYLSAVKLSSSGEWCKIISNDESNSPEPYAIEEFINLLLVDDEFYSKWGDDCCDELTYEERYKYWFANNYETGMEYHEGIVPDFDNSYYRPTPKRKLTESITEKYIDFILNEMIPPVMRVELPSPQEDGKHLLVKLGPVVYMDVKLDVIERYTRSVLLRLSFDRYEIDQLFFIPIESAPTRIRDKFYSKISRIAYQAFLDDGRRDDVKRMYEEKSRKIFSSIGDVVSKMNDHKKAQE